MHATIDKEDNPDDGENLYIQQKSNGMVNENYLLLDNQSTVNQINSWGWCVKTYCQLPSHCARCPQR
jgi:hypothetical protein